MIGWCGKPCLEIRSQTPDTFPLAWTGLFKAMEECFPFCLSCFNLWPAWRCDVTGHRRLEMGGHLLLRSLHCNAISRLS